MTINKQKWSSPRTKLNSQEKDECSAKDMRYSSLTSIKHAANICTRYIPQCTTQLHIAQVNHLCDEIRRHLQTSHTEFCEQRIYKQC